MSTLKVLQDLGIEGEVTLSIKQGIIVYLKSRKGQEYDFVDKDLNKAELRRLLEAIAIVEQNF